MMKEMRGMTNNPLYLILTAAGSSSRLGLRTKKEYLPVQDGTVLSEGAKTFLTTAHFDAVIITVPKDGKEQAQNAFFSNPNMESFLKGTPVFFIEGGSSRQASVFAALTYLHNMNTGRGASPAVLIHDAARPFVTSQIISDIIEATKQYGAAVPAIPAVDTQKEKSSENGIITRHLDRKNIVAVQTPQGFSLEPLFLCHQTAARFSHEYTDDTEIWDAFPDITGNKKVHIVDGDIKNKKITYKEDLAMLTPQEERPQIRIGFGTDLHRLVPGRKFMLGGVDIPAMKGELAHSDGDVLLHAIADALLGASGLGDIGSYFPPEDAKWKDADSAFLLRTIWTDVKKEGWELENMDCVVETEAPKLLPWRQAIIKSIASILEVESTRVFVKAKTNEKQDAVGQGNAIKTYCTCLLSRRQPRVPAQA